MNKVVLSGIGIVGPHGTDVAPFLDNETSTPSCFSAWPSEVALPHEGAMVAQVKEFPCKQFFTVRKIRMMDRAMQFASTAAGLAIADAGIDDDLQRASCTFLGTAHAEFPSCYNFIRPKLGGKNGQLNAADFPKIARNVACGQVAIRFGMQGPSTVLASGSLASLEAVLRAAQFIRDGRSNIALVGGYEALSRFSLYFWANHYRDHLAGNAPQFFGRENGCLIPSEGACMLVLESEQSALERGAPIYCEISKWESGRVGSDQDPATALSRSWDRVSAEQPVGLFSASVGGSNRPHEVAESQALEKWITDRNETKVMSVRASIGEGEAWASALQVGAAAKSLRDLRVAATPDVAGDACKVVSNLNNGGELSASTALISGVGVGGSYSNLFLARP